MVPERYKQAYNRGVAALGGDLHKRWLPWQRPGLKGFENGR